jgi:dephospho-CoA kinase
MITIGLVGSIGSGKDTAAQYILQKHSFTLFTFSYDGLGDILKKSGLELNRKNLQRLGKEIRAREGNAIVAKLLWAKIEERKEEKVIINGFRYPEELTFFKENSSEFMLIGVDCPLPVRYARVRRRNTKENKEMTLDEFKAYENAATELNIPILLNSADYIVINDSDLNTLYRRIDAILEDSINVNTSAAFVTLRLK